MMRTFAVLLSSLFAIAACGGSNDVSVGRDDKQQACALGVCHVDQFCTLIVADCSSVPGGGSIGPCQRKPTGCSDMPDLVCGCDGKTYPNVCYAAGAGQGVMATGACVSGR